MENLAIADTGLVDAATLSAGSQLGSMPVGNLQKIQPLDRWRTDDLANAYLIADLGAAETINLIALLYHNLSSAATWRVRAAASETDLTAAPAYDSGSVNAWHNDWPADQSPLHSRIWLGASTETYQWWRVDISDSGNPDTYVEAGRLLIDNAWQLPQLKNIEYGWGMTFVDPSEHSRSRGGQDYSNKLNKYRRLDCSLNFLDEDEMYDNYYEIQRKRGASQDVFVMRDPAAGKHLLRQSLYGKMKSLSQQTISHQQHRIFRARLVVEEIL